jgi:hypothetical protein
MDSPIRFQACDLGFTCSRGESGGKSGGVGSGAGDRSSKQISKLLIHKITPSGSNPSLCAMLPFALARLLVSSCRGNRFDFCPRSVA